MKNLIKGLSIIVLLFLISCSSDNSSEDEIFEEVITESTAESDMDTMTSEANLQGEFVSDAHPTTGTAKVNTDKTVLDFENFMTDNGPKLLVYLSTTVDSTDYVDLGDLKGINGNYSYEIPNNTDVSKYKYVVIWCVDFSVSFGHAELK